MKDSKQAAVETQQLTKRFGDFTAVDQVDLTIPQGEIFGLLGPNGAGKTTIIHMLCGIMRPSDGRGQVLGYDVAEGADALKQRIGYMSQRFSLYPDLTALENLQFYASIYKVPRHERQSQIEDLLAMAGLEQHRNRLTSNLSGAWRQRLALACAIVHRPAMLFLDEATAGVDPVSRREFWDLIYTMAGEGVTVLATTHYMDEAEYCNTVGMMYRGQLITTGQPDTLRRSLPGHLIQIDCDDPGLAETLLDEMDEVLDSSVHGAYLHAILKDDSQMGAARRRLEGQGIQVRRAEKIEPSLEDVFIALIAEYRGEQDRILQAP